MKGLGMITRERVRFYHQYFYIFYYFLMPYRLILSALEEFRFFVTVGPSAPFGPTLNSPKIDNFRSYLINLISRVPKVSKTV